MASPMKTFGTIRSLRYLAACWCSCRSGTQRRSLPIPCTAKPMRIFGSIQLHRCQLPSCGRSSGLTKPTSEPLQRLQRKISGPILRPHCQPRYSVRSNGHLTVRSPLVPFTASQMRITGKTKLRPSHLSCASSSRLRSMAKKYRPIHSMASRTRTFGLILSCRFLRRWRGRSRSFGTCRNRLGASMGSLTKTSGRIRPDLSTLRFGSAYRLGTLRRYLLAVCPGSPMRISGKTQSLQSLPLLCGRSLGSTQPTSERLQHCLRKTSGPILRPRGLPLYSGHSRGHSTHRNPLVRSVASQMRIRGPILSCPYKPLSNGPNSGRSQMTLGSLRSSRGR